MTTDERIYYSTKTLVGGDPDCNRRMIYYGHKYECGQLIATFNVGMHEWSVQDEINLRVCLAALNNNR